MTNLLLEDPEYQITETRLGTWRRYVYSTGGVFEEFRSHGTFLGLPWIHYTRGRSPETGKRVMARGVLAVGRIAAGILAIGQAAFGVFAIGQLGLGLLLGLGQATCGVAAVGQIALGLDYGLGQVATGATVIAQVGYGEHVLAQIGWGEHVWSTERHDPVAEEHFRALWQSLREALDL
jgi:hypothetical protein